MDTDSAQESDLAIVRKKNFVLAQYSLHTKVLRESLFLWAFVLVLELPQKPREKDTLPRRSLLHLVVQPQEIA